ncbi:hypothetical protein DSUL_160003 [Desulfovibrionales bacterium]
MKYFLILGPGQDILIADLTILLLQVGEQSLHQIYPNKTNLMPA